MKLILKSSLLAAMVVALLGATTVHATVYGGPLPASACAGSMIKCISKMDSCLLGVYNKIAGKGLTIAGSLASFDKCRNGFLGDPLIGKGCWEKALIKNAGCIAASNSLAVGAVVASKIEARAFDVYSALVPKQDTPPIVNKCAASKMKCASKNDSCVLGKIGKIFKAGGSATADPTLFVKCNAAACTKKTEDKLGAECATLGDGGLLKNGADAFANDALYNILKGELNANSQRCTNDTAIPCTNNTPCTGGGGTCQFFFGAPLPLTAGGISTCVVTQWNGGISGTFNTGGGGSGGTANVLSKAYVALTIPEPCPRCLGSAEIPNDGIAGGTCSIGVHAGAPCDANGESPVPAFGKTSLDCGPNGSLVGTLPVNLDNTNTGLVTKTVATGTSPSCNGSPGDLCLCASCSGNSSIPCASTADCTLAGAGTCTNAAGEPRQPNSCVDDTSTVVNGGDCAVSPGGAGSCPETADTHCLIESYVGCSADSDCTAPGDLCTVEPRPCFPGYNGNNGDSIKSIAGHGAPHHHVGYSSFASVFCVAPTSSSSVNSAAGLPGPGRLRLSGVAFEDGDGTTCTGLGAPTKATFLPTATTGALDTGWTGFAHHAPVIGQGKVTVSVTGCSGPPGNCNCTYSGPVAN